MFTIEQLRATHSKVKSGADFPNYVQEIIKLGVTYYETYVADGHTNYHGKEDYEVSSDSKYATLTIADKSDAKQFKINLKEHQQGKTDYPTFCKDCAKSGVEKWKVCTEKMTCIYYNKVGEQLLVETIPTP